MGILITSTQSFESLNGLTLPENGYINIRGITLNKLDTEWQVTYVVQFYASQTYANPILTTGSFYNFLEIPNENLCSFLYSQIITDYNLTNYNNI